MTDSSKTLQRSFLTYLDILLVRKYRAGNNHHDSCIYTAHFRRWAFSQGCLLFPSISYLIHNDSSLIHRYRNSRYSRHRLNSLQSKYVKRQIHYGYNLHLMYVWCLVTIIFYLAFCKIQTHQNLFPMRHFCK